MNDKYPIGTVIVLMLIGYVWFIVRSVRDLIKHCRKTERGGVAMKAVLTGSRRYGTPRADSDVDVVIRADEQKLIETLVANADGTGSMGAGHDQFSVKYGKLNLIVCLTDAAYLTWADGNASLDAQAPVTRDNAVKVFSALRTEYGVR